MTLAAILGMCMVMVSPSNHLIEGRALPLSQETPATAPKPANPAQESPPEQPPPPTTTPDSTAQPETPAPVPPKKSGAKPSLSTTKKSVPKKSTTNSQKAKTTPDASPSKVVVRDGSTTDPTVQLSPGLSQQQASQQLQRTDQLLESTDASLKKISGLQLKPGQQEMMNQVRRYSTQAKAAVTAGDLDRAHNLAFKARQLADELIKQSGVK